MSDIVHAVLLHWKNYKDTKSCLKQLLSLNLDNLHTIVVDNDSNDGSLEKLKIEFKKTIFIKNKTNVGFSCGVNVGIKKALSLNTDYVLVLNSDILVDRNFLKPALDIAKKTKNLGAITGKIFFKTPKNMIWHAGGYIDPWRVQGVGRGTLEMDVGQYDKVEQTGWASGAMSLIPKQTFEKVGLYPEEHFFGQEEWDFSTSILKKSLKIIYVPDFSGIHDCGGSYKGGHPILNIYGGYLSKMIYAEKYMSKIVFTFWKILFYIYLKTKWRKLAWEGCTNKDDYIVKYRAGLLAFKHHKTIKKVTLSQLKIAADELGPAPSWGNSWASEKKNLC